MLLFICHIVMTLWESDELASCNSIVCLLQLRRWLQTVRNGVMGECMQCTARPYACLLVKGACETFAQIKAACPCISQRKQSADQQLVARAWAEGSYSLS